MDANIPAGAIPVDQFEASPSGNAVATSNPQMPAGQPSAVPPGAIPVDQFESQEEHFGSPTEQVKTAVEGLAQGVIGPIAPFIEKRYLGVKPEDIAARAEENPWISGLSKATGLTAGMLTGTGEAALMAKVGEAVTGVTGLAKAAEVGGVASKIGAAAMRQAAEMTVLGAGDEITKKILNDPDQTAQTAIGNVGLAAVLGGVVGGALGSINPIWKATIGDTIGQKVADFTGEMKQWLDVKDPATAIKTELEDLIDTNESLRKNLYSGGEGAAGLKGQLLQKAMPEVSEANTAKINDQISSVQDMLTKTLAKHEDNEITGSSMKYVRQYLKDFNGVVNDPEATYAQKFDALNDLKRNFQSHVRYNLDASQTAFGEIANRIAPNLQKTLEDTKVWGAAGDTQKKINGAISQFISTQNDIVSKFMSKLAGEVGVDSNKINTFIKQLGKSTGKTREDVLSNYLQKSEELHTTINNLLAKHGIKSPIKPTSQAILRSVTDGTKPPGAQLAQKLMLHTMDRATGQSLGGVLGYGAGYALGAPEMGFILGEHAVGPLFKSVLPALTKPLLDNDVSSSGVKAALDYGTAVIKGDKALNSSIQSVFKGAAQSAGSQIPSQLDREKLDKQITKYRDNPQALIEHNEENQVGHYLPAHQQSLVTTSTGALQYLGALQPKPVQPSPLDAPIPPTPTQKARYDRALNIAQSPNSIMTHIKNGTLQASDVNDIKTMYPALYTAQTQKITEQIANMNGAEANIPYKTKIALSLFLGQPLDTSMTPTSIIAAQPQPKPQQQAPGGTPKKGASSKLGKDNKAFMTADQAAEADRTARS